MATSVRGGTQVVGSILIIRIIDRDVRGAVMGNLDDTREGMNQQPQFLELAAALRAAGSAHHEFEQTVLNGIFDEQWPMFYAAFVLGRLGEFTTPSALTSWLKEVPTDGVWTEMAAKHLINRMSQ